MSFEPTIFSSLSSTSKSNLPAEQKSDLPKGANTNAPAPKPKETPVYTVAKDTFELAGSTTGHMDTTNVFGSAKWQVEHGQFVICLKLPNEPAVIAGTENPSRCDDLKRYLMQRIKK